MFQIAFLHTIINLLDQYISFAIPVYQIVSTCFTGSEVTTVRWWIGSRLCVKSFKLIRTQYKTRVCVMDEDTYWFRVWLGLFVLLTLLVLLTTYIILYITGMNPDINIQWVCIGYIESVTTYIISVIALSKLMETHEKTD